MDARASDDTGYWTEWHARYDRPNSSMPRRLAEVQRLIRQVLDASPEGPIRVLSICAGQSRDLAGVLQNHPRRRDVVARLVDLDEPCTAYARERFAALGLSAIEAVTADASTTSAFVDAVPADLILACGIFGNISDGDVKNTVEHVDELCAPSATVIWTRHRQPPDLTPTIRAWFDAAGFEELSFDSEEGSSFGIGVARLKRTPRAFVPGRRLFTFVGDGTGALRP